MTTHEIGQTAQNGASGPYVVPECQACDVAGIAAHIKARAEKTTGQLIVALAGAPASGKSSLAGALAAELAQAPVLAMDGFHLDNAILEARDLIARKGAPETFDVSGFSALLARLRGGEAVIAPIFDRALDLARAGAEEISPEAPVVIVEGNYLLLSEPPWDTLSKFWDYSILLDVPESVLRARLLDRWRGYGFDEAAAAHKAEENDLPNGLRISVSSAKPDLRVLF